MYFIELSLPKVCLSPQVEVSTWRCLYNVHFQNKWTCDQRTLTVGGRITVQLNSLQFNWFRFNHFAAYIFFFFGIIQTSQTGYQLYSDPSP